MKAAVIPAPVGQAQAIKLSSRRKSGSRIQRHRPVEGVDPDFRRDDSDRRRNDRGRR